MGSPLRFICAFTFACHGLYHICTALFPFVQLYRWFVRLTTQHALRTRVAYVVCVCDAVRCVRICLLRAVTRCTFALPLPRVRVRFLSRVHLLYASVVIAVYIRLVQSPVDADLGWFLFPAMTCVTRFFLFAHCGPLRTAPRCRCRDVYTCGCLYDTMPRYARVRAAVRTPRLFTAVPLTTHDNGKW